MVALQIRDVPDEVRDILAEQAQQAGQSLQSFLLDLVKAEAARARNVTLLRRFEDRSDGTSATSMDDIVRERDTAREEWGTRPGGAT